ncbi:putative SH3 domain protein [Favolaschia claudopus]|uniref:SH3 domain protein n=1 Tax=Favolaschia claudopus TaxID=2862362 RepID=A0AAW0BLY6_9AGAR
MKVLYASALFLPLVLATDYTVGVGKDENTGKKGLGFDPSSIHPIAGDVIVWEFRSGSHSAVQSTFDNPCTPKEGGFNSGVQTVDDNLEVDAPGLPTVRLLVNDTEPLWFFDQAGGLCNQGAVISVNPSASQTDAVFKANAAKAPASSGNPSSNSGAPPPSSAGNSASQSPSGSASAPAQSPSQSPSSGQQLIAGSTYAGAILAALWALI